MQADLRGNAYEARFVRGGHAYYSDEECGDARLLALDPLIASAGPESFDCALSSEPLETGRPASRVHAERADSPEARAEVQAWLQAPEPHYETPFAPELYDHLEVRELRLAFTCGDPRLQQVGAEWWAPLFGRVDRLLDDGVFAEPFGSFVGRES